MFNKLSAFFSSVVYFLTGIKKILTDLLNFLLMVEKAYRAQAVA